MDCPNGMWEKLVRHRRKAAAYPLDVLVWGPANDGSPEFSARTMLRERLLQCGHNAQFSEDLAQAPDALRDPMDDEVLQAIAADVIFMIYGSRGTQSERDTILTDPTIARKAVVFVEESVLRQVERCVSGESWKKMAQVARIVPYKRSDLPNAVVTPALAEAESIRCACYVRELRIGGLR